MMGKTNAQVRGTHYVVGEPTVTEGGRYYLPADDGLDYYERVYVPPFEHNYLQKLCRLQLTRVSEEEIGRPVNIPTYLFYRRSGIATVDLPSSVQLVQSFAFSTITSLKNVTINCPNLHTIENSAFSDCRIQNLTVTAPNLRYGPYAFSGNHYLTSVNLVAILALDSNFLYDADALSEIAIPTSCTNLSNNSLGVSNRAVINYPDLYVTFERHAIPNDAGTAMTQSCTSLSRTTFGNRQNYHLLVPLDSLCAYRYEMTAVNAVFTDKIGVYLDCEAGDTLPVGVHQQYLDRDTKDFTLVWYSDKAMTTPVSSVTQAGRYYGVPTVVEEV